MSPDSTRPAPRALYVVGALALLWSTGGAFDYLMTVSQNATYLAAFTPEQRAYLDGFPAWTTAAWAVGVWGAVAGCLALLLRSRYAVWLFATSIAGLVLTSLYSYVLSDGIRVMGLDAARWAFTAAVWAVAVGLLVFARAMARRGVLR